MIESIKYLEKNTFGQKVKKIRLQCFFKKISIDVEIDDLPAPLGRKIGKSLKFQMGWCGSC